MEEAPYAVSDLKTKRIGRRNRISVFEAAQRYAVACGLKECERCTVEKAGGIFETVQWKVIRFGNLDLQMRADVHFRNRHQTGKKLTTYTGDFNLESPLPERKM